MYVCNLHYICKFQSSIGVSGLIFFLKSKIVWDRETTELVKVFAGKLKNGILSTNPR